MEKVAQEAAALALDILQNRLHLPLNDEGKINIDLIEDQITIGLYRRELRPMTQEVFDLAVSTVQEMVDMENRVFGKGNNES